LRFSDTASSNGAAADGGNPLNFGKRPLAKTFSVFLDYLN
jgi:hypothetical protein